jgi:hypothetical protein
MEAGTQLFEETAIDNLGIRRFEQYMSRISDGMKRAIRQTRFTAKQGYGGRGAGPIWRDVK